MHIMNTNIQRSSTHQSPALPYAPVVGVSNVNSHDSTKQQTLPLITSSGPPQIPPAQFSPEQTQFPSAPYSQPSMLGQVTHSQPSTQSPSPQNGSYLAEMLPLKPVFGVSLEDLFNRDGSAVPMVVYQCLQAVDLFGLEVEGIYRLSGTASHITKLRSVFDNGKEMELNEWFAILIPIRRFSGRLQKPRKFLPRCQQCSRFAQAILSGSA